MLFFPELPWLPVDQLDKVVLPLAFAGLDNLASSPINIEEDLQSFYGFRKVISQSETLIQQLFIGASRQECLTSKWLTIL